MTEILEVNNKNSFEKFSYMVNYSDSDYCDDVVTLGLEKTWNNICEYLKINGENTLGILKVDNFGELYEKGLALVDKNKKKASGQYYTPDDVATVMAKWLKPLEGENICDVACGTGKLILTYLQLFEKNEVQKLLSQKRLFLYDIDKTALKVCKSIILYTYGYEYEDCINIICDDFLNENVKLPPICKAISNPPYANVSNIPETWAQTDVQKDTKELYSSFIEKIIKQSKSAVIISPYSFLGGSKFYSLREVMNNYNGFVVSFDNVPGTIFCGRKHGIFNSNTSNSVRAAITVVQNLSQNKSGFKISPLIRFKAIERESLLKNDVLESFLNPQFQKVCDTAKMYYKCDNRLDEIFKKWQSMSDKNLSDYVTSDGNYSIYMPNTCRYYTTASAEKMNRNGQIALSFDDEDVFYYVYCLINSSFAYWHWRLYDGEIIYSKNLLLMLPVFFSKLSIKDKKFFEEVALEMMASARTFLITKNNVGVQENIRYPKEYRDKLNQKILEILEVDENSNIFDIIHSNMALRVNLC